MFAEFVFIFFSSKYMFKVKNSYIHIYLEHVWKSFDPMADSRARAYRHNIVLLSPGQIIMSSTASRDRLVDKQSFHNITISTIDANRGSVIITRVERVE